jgi:predicted tellurium resistance membrane protein TerC
LIEYLSDPLFWTRLLQIIGVDIILAGDNAVVIALACRNLDPRHRNKAIIAGSLGADRGCACCSSSSSSGSWRCPT